MCELGWFVDEGYRPSVVDMTTGCYDPPAFVSYSYANQPNFTDQQNI